MSLAKAADDTIPLNAYAEIGSMFAQSSRIGELGWSEEQFAAFLSGVRASFKHQPYPLSDYARRAYQEMTKRVSELESQDLQKRFSQPAELKKYLREMCKRFDLQQSDSGLAFGVKTAGSELRPGPQDTVVVSLVAASSDTQTDLPKLKADHLRTKVSDLLPGLAEGVQMMTLDSKAMFILPPDLSFGSGNWPEGVLRGTPICFLVTLHEVINADAVK